MRALHGVADLGRLQQGVLLGMDADADVVAVALGVILGVGAAVAAALVAVREAGRCAVVAGGDDPLVGDQDRAHVAAQAGRPLAGRHREQHEVLLTRGAGLRTSAIGGRHIGGGGIEPPGPVR